VTGSLAPMAGVRIRLPVRRSSPFSFVSSRRRSGLLSAIGLAGMDRALTSNMCRKAQSGRAGGDIDTLLLDKTGTIRSATARRWSFSPGGRRQGRLAEASVVASLGDPTRRKSILRWRNDAGRGAPRPSPAAVILPFSARPALRPGRNRRPVFSQGRGRRRRSRRSPARRRAAAGLAEIVARWPEWKDPIVVARGRRSWRRGARDIVNRHPRPFVRLRAMGLRVIMVTGDNPLTAAAIAGEAGVDGFLAEAKPKPSWT